MRFFGLIPSFWAGVAAWLPKPFKSNRTTVGTYFTKDGILASAPPRTLRPLFVYNGSEWVRQGDLVEAASTNLSPNCVPDSTWTLTHDGTYVPDVSPDGTQNSWRISQKNPSSHGIPLSIYTSASVNIKAGSTLSFFTKKYENETNISFTLVMQFQTETADNQNGGQNIQYDGKSFNGLWNYCSDYVSEQVGPDWVRHSMVIPRDMTLKKGELFFQWGGADNVTTDAAIWGIQIEEGRKTSLIYTDGSTATRTAD